MRFTWSGNKYSTGASAELVKRIRAATTASENKPSAPKPEIMPTLTLKPHLVAFIDILGFGNDVKRAECSVQALQEAYYKLRTVQREFEHPEASRDARSQADNNCAYGRDVIALSDAVVVAVTTDCEMGPYMGGYDLLGSAIAQIAAAQAACAAKGIFLRGGICHGPFHRAKDLLLSPALAHAYELESKYAENPVIVVPESTLAAIYRGRSASGHGQGADPLPKYFRPHHKTWRKGGKGQEQQLFYLDYLAVSRDEAHLEWHPDDHKTYLAAKKGHDGKRVRAMLNLRSQRSAAVALQHHKKRVVAGYKAAKDERARDKYRWLMNYHNQCCPNKYALLKKQRIDLKKFKPSRQ